jgi:hypothetical protein
VAERQGKAHPAPSVTGTTARALAARLPVPGYPAAQAARDIVLATWGGIEIEWHYMSCPGQPADVGQVATALLAHLSVLAGWCGERDAAPTAEMRGAGLG